MHIELGHAMVASETFVDSSATRRVKRWTASNERERDNA